MSQEIFRARLKAKAPDFKAQNLTNKRLDEYSARLHRQNPDVKDEVEHDKLIDVLNELVSFEDIAKADDRVQTLEARLKNKPAPIQPAPTNTGGDTEEQEDDEPEEGDTTKPAKPRRERVPQWAKELREEVRSLKVEKVQNTIRDKIRERLKDEDGKVKVPEKFWTKRPLPEREEDIETFITEAESDWADLYKEINPLVKEGETGRVHKPNRSTSTSERVDEKTLDSIVDKF